MPKFKKFEKVWISTQGQNLKEGYVVSYDKYATRPYAIQVDKDLFYCCEFQITKRPSQQSKVKKEPAVSAEIRAEAERLAEQRMEELKVEKISFERVCTLFEALYRTSDHLKQTAPSKNDSELIIQLAKNQIYEEIKNGCTMEKAN